jgi:hypothetical protein
VARGVNRRSRRLLAMTNTLENAIALLSSLASLPWGYVCDTGVTGTAGGRPVTRGEVV